MRVGNPGNGVSAKDWSEIASDANLRKHVIKEIRDLLEKYDLDGVLIFWKAPGCPVSYKNNFLSESRVYDFVLGAFLQRSIHQGQKRRNFILQRADGLLAKQRENSGRLRTCQ